MKTKFYFIISICSLVYSSKVISQNVYGITGLVKTPNAYTIESGKASLSFYYLEDYFHYKHKATYNKWQWAAPLCVGFHSRIEVTLRLVGIPSFHHAAESDRAFNYFIDRNFSVKGVIIKEKKNQPQLAIGFQDFVGTRIYNSTYAVLSKKIALDSSHAFVLTAGYGTKATDLIYTSANNYRLIGVFGSAEYQYKKFASVFAEYDAMDFAYGIRISLWKFLSFTGFESSRKKFGGGFTLKAMI